MARLRVRLTPRGGADRIEAVEADAAGLPLVRARVRAAPTEGQANAALEKLLARALGVPRSTVRVARGQTARIKTVDIDGLEDAEALATLRPPAAAAP